MKVFANLQKVNCQYGFDHQHNTDAEKVSEITESMLRDGWIGNPVLCVESSNGDTVLDGHHRIRAAEEAEIDIYLWQIDRDDFEKLIAEEFDGDMPNRLSDLDDFIFINDKSYDNFRQD